MTDYIFLIQPRAFKADVVYKVFLKNNNLYFCKVGGQFYNISDEDKWNPDLHDDDLLKKRSNFKINLSEIQSININGKQSHWTGKTPNNGTVRIMCNNQLKKFIIHPVETADTVKFFYSDILSDSASLIIESENICYDSQKRTILPAEDKSHRFKTFCKFYNIFTVLTCICSIWLLLYPKPYLLAFLTNLIFPLVGYAIYYLHSDIVNFSESMYRREPSVLVLIVPPIILTLRAFLTYRVFYTPIFWIVIIIIAVISAFIILNHTKEFKVRKWLIVLIPLLLFSYIYSITTIANCYFDTSVPIRYISIVEDKYDGKDKTIALSPWGPVKSPTEIGVNTPFYEKTQIGKPIYIYLKKGLFGLSWYIPSLKSTLKTIPHDLYYLSDY